MDCPVCKNAMIVLELAEVEVDYCTDCSGIWLDVWDQNTRAQEFYRRHTFDLVGERPYVVGKETQRHLLMYRGLENKDSIG